MEIVSVALLAVESVMLVLSIIVLMLSAREWRGRRELLESLTMATRALTREEYFNLVISTLREAREDVFGIVTGSKPRTEVGRKALARIVDEIGVLSGRGVRIRYLMPMRETSLRVGHMYTSRGGEVKYFPGLVIRDFRYMVVDRRAVVIGLPERAGEGQPTRRGYLIRSEGLALLLKEDFESKWGSREALSYEEYVRLVVSQMVKNNPDISSETIAAHLELPVEEVERVRRGFGG